jgi:hypothetical protein
MNYAYRVSTKKGGHALGFERLHVDKLARLGGSDSAKRGSVYTLCFAGRVG